MKLIKWADEHRWFYTLAIISFIAVPVIVQITPIFVSGQTAHGDWLGFWGSYLGIIPSGLIAYVVAKYQVSLEEKRIKEEKIQELKISKLTELLEDVRYVLNSILTLGETYRILSRDLDVFLDVFKLETENEEQFFRTVFLNAFSRLNVPEFAERLVRIDSNLSVYEYTQDNKLLTDDDAETLIGIIVSFEDNFERVEQNSTFQDDVTKDTYSYIPLCGPAFVNQIIAVEQIVKKLKIKIQKEVKETFKDNQLSA